MDDPFYKGVYRIAGELDGPFSRHTWGCRDIGLMERLAREFRDRLSGGPLRRRAGRLPARRESSHGNENFYLDFTCSWGYANLPEYLVRTCGASKNPLRERRAVEQHDRLAQPHHLRGYQR